MSGLPAGQLGSSSFPESIKPEIRGALAAETTIDPWAGFRGQGRAACMEPSEIETGSPWPGSGVAVQGTTTWPAGEAVRALVPVAGSAPSTHRVLPPPRGGMARSGRRQRNRREHSEQREASHLLNLGELSEQWRRQRGELVSAARCRLS
jgi:hypothetical protein